MQNETRPTFTLAHKQAADVHSWGDTDLIDVFTVKSGSVELLDISFILQANEETVAKVTPLAYSAIMLPGIFSGFQLIGFIDEVLNTALSEGGHEFYANCFYDENDNEIELPLDFYSLCNQ